MGKEPKPSRPRKPAEPAPTVIREIRWERRHATEIYVAAAAFLLSLTIAFISLVNAMRAPRSAPCRRIVSWSIETGRDPIR